MLWLIGIGCLAAGLCLGVLAASRLNNANPARIAELEQQVQQLQEQHRRYKDNVSEHFNMTAELVQHMTESYRDVYQHLASGAQDLCSGEVASKLLPASEENVFRVGNNHEEGVQAPKDYAPRKHPEQTGALSEEFGMDKPEKSDD
ncbi:MAG: DUF1043 family protein [Pseudomonadales bacterium]|nr:DUF1043 family protein [Pseudomonadales bacterium]